MCSLRCFILFQGLDDGLLQNIAKEMNIAETAFVHRLSPGDSFEKSM